MVGPYRTPSPPADETPKKHWLCRLGFHHWVAVDDGLPPVKEGNGNAFGGYELVYGRYQAINCTRCGAEALWDVTWERTL